LNVIYFWDEILSRLKKIYSILKQNGKVIIFMADAEYFKDIKQFAGKTIFHQHSVDDVVKEMGKIGFKTIETIEHTKEKKCYYLFNYEFFRYNKGDDTYTCPGGQVLRTNGSWYRQHTSAGNISWFKQYKTKSCRKCTLRSQCTRSKKERLIQRSEYAEYYERNHINIQQKEHLYKRRQAIVEHPYGTIKRSR